MNLGISIMVFKQSQASPSLFSFMEPLSYYIWMAILLVRILIRIVFNKHYNFRNYNFAPFFSYFLFWFIFWFNLKAYAATSIVLYLVSRFSPYAWNIENDGIWMIYFFETIYSLLSYINKILKENGEEIISHDFTMSNTLWFCLSAFLQQGIDIIPR